MDTTLGNRNMSHRQPSADYDYAAYAEVMYHKGLRQGMSETEARQFAAEQTTRQRKLKQEELTAKQQARLQMRGKGGVNR